MALSPLPYSSKFFLGHSLSRNDFQQAQCAQNLSQCLWLGFYLFCFPATFLVIKAVRISAMPSPCENANGFWTCFPFLLSTHSIYTGSFSQNCALEIDFSTPKQSHLAIRKYQVMGKWLFTMGLLCPPLINNVKHKELINGTITEHRSGAVLC